MVVSCIVPRTAAVSGTNQPSTESLTVESLTAESDEVIAVAEKGAAFLQLFVDNDEARAILLTLTLT